MGPGWHSGGYRGCAATVNSPTRQRGTGTDRLPFSNRRWLIHHAVRDVVPGKRRVEQPSDFVAEGREIAFLELGERDLVRIHRGASRKTRLDRLVEDHVAVFLVLIHLDDADDGIGPTAVEICGVGLEQAVVLE